MSEGGRERERKTPFFRVDETPTNTHQHLVFFLRRERTHSTFILGSNDSAVVTVFSSASASISGDGNMTSRWTR